MKVKFFDPAKDYLRFRKEYDQAWESVNLRGDLILRKDTEEFEERLANYVGTKYAVALSSGTDAIYLSLKALGIKGGVALPSHTFKSTCGAVINAGAIPLVYDMDGKIDELAEAHISVHIAGEIAPIPDLGIPVIEDACQAFGAIKYPTSKAQCWSFYPAKILGGKGDNGAVTTDDPQIYEYIKEARNHFKTDNRDFGGNYRMDNLHAALLNVKLGHIDDILSRRKEIAEKYLKELEGIVGLPNNDKFRVWQDFIARIERRDELYDFLKEKGVETMKNEYLFSIAYPKLPLAAKYEAETLRIPCNENLTDEEVNYVIESIKQF